MPAVKTAKKKIKHRNDDIFSDITTLLNGVYKQMTKKGGLLHGIMSTKKTHKIKRRK
ncbi:MAG: hypothetical protein HYZ79_03350 [Candidatus Melainabacteria bacterium]|nr:hypothetical protein [Candidatus Melainabacteria bacterium]